MNGRCVHILLCIMVLAWAGAGCIHSSYEYTAGDYVAVTAKDPDTPESLAEKYLNDADKGWVITGFNNVKKITPGMQLVIPLHPFSRVGGMGQGGYQLVPVLCYPSVRAAEQPSEAEPKNSFEQQMAYLRKKRFQVISLSALTGFLEAKGTIHEKSLVITLDDNSRDVVTIALPVLEKFGYPATVFVDPGLMGKPGNLTEGDVQLLSDKGLNIQCRTGWAIDQGVASGEVKLKQYFQTLARAIPAARDYLEKLTGKPCVYYAFSPSGGNSLLIGLLEKEGFTSAFNRNGNANPFYVDHFDIGRTLVSPDWPADTFSEKLSVFSKLE